jgi:diguanylate cyclase (GGDEF)-like protein
MRMAWLPAQGGIRGALTGTGSGCGMGVRSAVLKVMAEARRPTALLVACAGVLLGVLIGDLLDHGTDDLLHTLAKPLLVPAVAASVALAVMWFFAYRRAMRADAANRLLRQAIDLVPCQFAAFDRERRLVACNDSYRSLHAPAFAAMLLPITYPALMRETVRQTFPPEEVEAEVARRVAAHDAADGTPFERQYPDGRWMHIVKKRLPGGEVAGFALDISALKAAQRQVDFMARHDPLTGLANRAAFTAALETVLGRPDGVGLLLIDLDHFKSVNDRHGHAAGDALLLAAGQRIAAALRPGDTVARMGGDEFAVIAAGIDAERAVLLAERLRTELCRPVAFAGCMLPLDASIGVAAAPVHGVDAEALMRAADLALYSVKRGGRGGIAPFSRELAVREMRGSWLRAALAETLETGAGLYLAWQAQHDLRDRRIIGAEALLRWHCAALDATIDPQEALATAAASGISLKLDAMVIEQALAQAARWHGVPGAPPRVAVNVTVASLRDPELPARVAMLLARHRVRSDQLEIEIPESLATRDLDAILPTLETLRDLGVRLALDDFGGGRSSLAHALRLPVSCLKLDRSVVAGLPGAAKSRALLRAITALARSLELEVLAEGVETEAQAFALRREGVSVVQGYLVGRPVPADQLFDPPRMVRVG